MVKQMGASKKWIVTKSQKSHAAPRRWERRWLMLRNQYLVNILLNIWLILSKEQTSVWKALKDKITMCLDQFSRLQVKNEHEQVQLHGFHKRTK